MIAKKILVLSGIAACSYSYSYALQQKSSAEMVLAKNEIDFEKKNGLCFEKKVETKVPSCDMDKKNNCNVAKPLVKEAEAAKKERTIIVANNITQDMMTYKKHWTGHYTPSKFIVKVNDQEVRNGEPKTVELTDDVIKMSFDFEFKVCGKVHKKGGKALEIKLPKDVEKIVSTFSWDDPNNLIIDKGEVLTSKEVS